MRRRLYRTAQSETRRADGGESRVLILNPVSGSADHTDRVRTLAAEHGFVIWETQAAGDGVDLACDATDADLIAAAGGDGTINEVVRGLWMADALDDTSVAVVPTGTGNNFAGNIGVQSVEQAFDVIAHGETRQIDLGIVRSTGEQTTTNTSEYPFVNSCIGGLTANASADTSSELKAELGAFAYVLQTVKSLRESKTLSLHVTTLDDTSITTSSAPDASWTGEAVFVLIGNGRRFPAEGTTQADMEDGQFNVTIIEDFPKLPLAGEAAMTRLLGGETTHITRFSTASLSVTVQTDAPATFSLDGEMVDRCTVAVETEAAALSMHVGADYEPTPQDSTAD
jgi:YegS/Rv2252/BmrU family lipid kinase